MFSSRQFRPLALATMFLVTGTLFAQRYQDRDHTMFHRPPSPATAQKRQPVQSRSATGHHQGSTMSAHARQGSPVGPSSSNESHGGLPQSH